MQETQSSGTEMIALPPAARAAIALKSVDTKARIKELVANSARIVDVIDVDGRAEAHRAGMNLRNVRTSIASTGKDARSDAQAFSKAVIDEERTLTALITPEEDRVIALRDKFDAKVAAEKAEREAKEAARKAGLQAKVDGIRNIPLSLAGEPSAAIAAEIAALRGFAPAADEFYDYATAAQDAANAAIVTLMSMHEAVVVKEESAAAAEAARVEAARVAAEQEAERQRQAAIARQQEADAAAARAEEQRKAAAALAVQQAAVAEQQRVFAEQQAAFAAQQKAAADQLAAERAAIKAEADALANARAIAAAEKRADEYAEGLKRAAEKAVIDAEEAEAIAFAQRQHESLLESNGALFSEGWNNPVVVGVDLAAPGDDITTLTEVDAAGAVVAVEAVISEPPFTPDVLCFTHGSTYEATDTIDAALFTGDVSGRELMAFEWFVARWSRRLQELRAEQQEVAA